MLLQLHTYPSKFDLGRNVMAQVKFINASFGSWAINVLMVIYLMNLTGQKWYVTELKWILPVIVSGDSSGNDFEPCSPSV